MDHILAAKGHGLGLQGVNPQAYPQPCQQVTQRSEVQHTALLKLHEELQSLIGRLSAACDRISGPVPTACGKSGDMVTPNNLTERTGEVISLFAGGISQLRSDIDRLEAYV